MGICCRNNWCFNRCGCCRNNNNNSCCTSLADTSAACGNGCDPCGSGNSVSQASGRLRLFPVGLHIFPLRLPVEFLLAERLQFLRHMGKPLLPVRELGLGLELE